MTWHFGPLVTVGMTAVCAFRPITAAHSNSPHRESVPNRMHRFEFATALRLMLGVWRAHDPLVRFPHLHHHGVFALQKYSSVHAPVRHHFNQERHLVTRSVYKQKRSAALEEWRALAA